MNNKLITALRTSANAIKNRTIRYDWAQPACCNCGILFCTLTGQSPVRFDQTRPKPIFGHDQSWTALTQQYCPVSGVPENELFKELFKHGLTQRDIINLEYLLDTRVLAKMIPKTRIEKKWWEFEPRAVSVPIDFKNPVDVMNYMKAWADILQEEGKDDCVEAGSKVEQLVQGSTN